MTVAQICQLIVLVCNVVILVLLLVLKRANEVFARHHAETRARLLAEIHALEELEKKSAQS